MRIKNMAMIVFISIFLICSPFAIYEMRGYNIISGLRSFNIIVSYNEVMWITAIFMIILSVILIYPIANKGKKGKESLTNWDILFNIKIIRKGIKSRIYIERTK